MDRLSAATEKEILEKVSLNDANGLQSMFADLKLSSVDFSDENGMTPLQHACYKGNKEIAQMLLDQVSQVLCSVQLQFSFFINFLHNFLHILLFCIGSKRRFKHFRTGVSTSAGDPTE